MRIVELTNAAVRTRCHSTVWKHASWMVIRKPGKEDYMKPKLYQMISLLSGMGKVVEKVFAKLLSDKRKRRTLLCDG